MQAIRQRKSVVDKNITVEIPDNFRNAVEIIVLSNADEKTNSYENRELLNVEDRILPELTVKELFPVILQTIQFNIKVNPTIQYYCDRTIQSNF